VALAQACLDAGRPACAGEMLQEAAAFDARYAGNAAEAFRRARRWDRALYLNGMVHDTAEKVRQRFGILLDMGEWDQAASLDPRLRRLGLTDDESLAYGLAYAHYRSGAFDRAEALLRSLRDPTLFRQAALLREAMQRCTEERVGCP
jgi:hypothetical protein